MIKRQIGDTTLIEIKINGVSVMVGEAQFDELMQSFIGWHGTIEHTNGDVERGTLISWGGGRHVIRGHTTKKSCEVSEEAIRGIIAMKKGAAVMALTPVAALAVAMAQAITVILSNGV